MLVETGNLKITDLSKQWQEVFPDGGYVEDLWTTDGRYVITSSYERNGILVQPSAWKVIRLGEKLKKQSEATGGSIKFEIPQLRHLPVPGWVYADGFAVDYEGRKVVDLKGPLALSNDGKLVATVDDKGNVTIKPTVILAEGDGDASGK